MQGELSDYTCLDSSVLIKILEKEENTEKAVRLMNTIISNPKTIVLPDFAWAEVGTDSH